MLMSRNLIEVKSRGTHLAFEMVNKKTWSRAQGHSVHGPVEIQLKARGQLAQAQLALHSRMSNTLIVRVRVTHINRRASMSELRIEVQYQTVEVDEPVRAVDRVERGERGDRAVHAERVHPQRESAAGHCGQMRQRATQHHLHNEAMHLIRWTYLSTAHLAELERHSLFVEQLQSSMSKSYIFQ